MIKIAKCPTDWNASNYVADQINKIRKEVGKEKLIIGVSGGVDSTVAAALIHKAIGDQSKAVLIDHGLMRKDESKICIAALKKGLGVNIHSYDESEVFLSKLENKKDPDLAYNQLIRPWKSRLGLIYIEKRTLVLDLQIILYTVIALFSKQRALNWVSEKLKQFDVDANIVRVSKRKDDLYPFFPPGSDEVVAPGIKNNNKNIEP